VAYSRIVTLYDPTQWHELFVASSAVLPGCVCYLVGGVSLLVAWGGGLACIVADRIGGMGGAVVNAWILLVEILR